MNLYDFNSVSNAFNQSLRKIFAQTVHVHQRQMYVALHSCAALTPKLYVNFVAQEANIHIHPSVASATSAASDSQPASQL